MIRLGSSFRQCTPEATIELAKQAAQTLGVSRVTDITRLDRLGVPVYASIRPSATLGSLCVNAGKGTNSKEAKVGAYMEALEFSAAEPEMLPRSQLDVVPAGDVNRSCTGQYDILDFCPRLGVEVDLASPIGVVDCENISKGTRCLAPVELICLPCPLEMSCQTIFGSSSNGLCSGNNPTEAILHGLFEVIERDIRSFQSANDLSDWVEPDSFPASVKALCTDLSAAGLELAVRTQNNQYRIPYFMAVICDVKHHNPIYCSGGYGCHVNSEIALVRAVTEAFQSRLSFIHGGRDDLVDRYDFFSTMSYEEKMSYAYRLNQRLKNPRGSRKFSTVPDLMQEANSIPEILSKMTALLSDLGFDSILVHQYAVPIAELSFARVIIPKLEFFNETTKRVGRRLRDYVRDTDVEG